MNGRCTICGEWDIDDLHDCTDAEVYDFRCECGSRIFTLKNNELHCSCGEIYCLDSIRDDVND